MRALPYALPAALSLGLLAGACSPAAEEEQTAASAGAYGAEAADTVGEPAMAATSGMTGEATNDGAQPEGISPAQPDTGKGVVVPTDPRIQPDAPTQG